MRAVDVLAWLRANLRSAEGRDVVIPAVAKLIETARDAEPVLRHVTAHDYNRRWFRDETATKLDALRAALALACGTPNNG